LNDATFQALLTRLRQDTPSPEIYYEQLRARLVQFLRLHAPTEAESLADEALDRLARRIHEGTAVESVTLFTLGVARMLVREASARLIRSETAARDAQLFQDETDDSAARETLHAALEQCLSSLGSAGASLILDYYSAGAGAERIEKRRHIAATLGLGLNALRNRALRLRDILERCIQSRLDDRDESAPADTRDE